MLSILFAMIVILALAGFVLAYAAWPSRGRKLPTDLPGVRWLDRAMDGVTRLEPALGPEVESETDEDTRLVG